MKKITLALTALIVGLAVMMVSAFADVIAGSGYSSLKDAVKTTLSEMSDGVDSFTIEATMSIKANGVLINEESSKSKYDNVARTNESINKSYYSKQDEASTSYSFTSDEKSIYKSGDEPYSVYTKVASSSDVQRKIFSNPFEEEEMEDIEKIADAFLGNLKDLVMAEESDGKTMYSGTLNQSQVPALANAVASFAAKQATNDMYTWERMDIPKLKSDIYINDVYGKAIKNQDGIIDSLVASGSITGFDENGTQHDISVEISFILSGINSTVVIEPDLSGKEVVYSEGYSENFSDKFLGTYSQNIVKTENGQYVKIGARVLEITGVDGKNISGRVYETYKDGSTPQDAVDFTFTGTADSIHDIRINYTDSDGDKEGVISIYESEEPELNLSLDVRYNGDNNGYSSKMHYNFRKVFE